MDQVRRLLCDADPAALVDVDPLQTGLRISVQLTTGELAGVLEQAGCVLGPLAIQPQPSVCCGGCGG
ncbi:hypothetical protein N788_00790 [Arenimonas donghaensis DSM 18148 = HO3-R19]|uniref:HMA domain-containing protein n=2 Tax=Arenimonas TaxID=490567 RepID=A0A087MLI6_9GAMM|nr:hypothetical protein N788_00790 [Arenimonas donghaensis DSM 18148 = HO3-R19]